MSLGTVIPQQPPARSPSWEELLRRPEKEGWESIDGVATRKASPDADHSQAQSELVVRLAGFRQPGELSPHGWWIFTEIDIGLEGIGLFRPDLAGWRRERFTPTKERPVRTLPDWICEVVSESNAAHDRVRKMRAYHRAGLPYYWLVDPREGTLQVFRHSPEAYALIAAAERHERVRAEPFEAIELVLSDLFVPEAAPAR